MPRLPVTTLESLIALALALGTILTLALTHNMAGDEAAKAALALVYGAASTWSRQGPSTPSAPSDGASS